MSRKKVLSESLISQFRGIEIRMYPSADNVPRIDVLARDPYGNGEVDVQTGEVVLGSLPSEILQEVRRWLDLRREAILRDWDRVQHDQWLEWIDPLD